MTDVVQMEEPRNCHMQEWERGTKGSWGRTLFWSRRLPPVSSLFDRNLWSKTRWRGWIFRIKAVDNLPTGQWGCPCFIPRRLRASWSLWLSRWVGYPSRSLQFSPRLDACRCQPSHVGRARPSLAFYIIFSKDLFPLKTCLPESLSSPLF